MKYSIIIPYYNHLDFVKEAINSILDQENFILNNLEVIIVDDESEIPLVIESLSIQNLNVKIVRQKNGGPSLAKNYGVSISNGEWLLFLDADNKLDKNYLSILEGYIAENTKVEVFYSDYLCFGDENGIKKSKNPDLYRLLSYNYIDNCALVKRSVFEKSGGFDEYLSRLGLEDWELWLRLMINNRSFCYIQKPLFQYRVRKDSRTKLEADLNVKKIREYVFQKFATNIEEIYSNLYLKNQMIESSLPKKIGDFILKPYRVLKSFVK